MMAAPVWPQPQSTNSGEVLFVWVFLAVLVTGIMFIWWLLHDEPRPDSGWNPGDGPDWGPPPISPPRTPPSTDIDREFAEIIEGIGLREKKRSREPVGVTS